MKKKVIRTLLSLFIFFLLLPCVVNAASVGASFSGNSTYKPGDTVSLSIHVGSVNDGNDGNVYAFMGTLNYDASCLEYQSVSARGGWSESTNPSNHKIILSNSGLNAGVSNGSVGTVKFKALKDCNTTVSMSSTSASDKAGDISVSFSGKSIRIYTPSSNNNLSSLSVSPGGITFNGGTSYSTNVGASVISVTVSAAAQDAKAKISGTGPHNLNYGANNINVTVTAEDGSKKTYTINVNRKDDRSANNNLVSLKIGNGKLQPGFSKGNTKYTMEVPFSVSKLSISATAEDPKSSVNISNPDLVAEETTTVSIKVTAENGSSKTYVINVKRGKDPNKPLSTNNYLSELTVSNGMLSPAFNKEKLNYAVYLPYEISNIDINAQVEDTRYATIKKEGSNDLSVGSNLFKYIVTAEDGSKREYTITVVRNESLDSSNIVVNTNTYLEKLSIKGGIITKKFNKNKNVYYYYKLGKKVSIKEALPEVKDNKVKIEKYDKSIIIIVEAESGARSYYILVEKSIVPIIIIVLLVLIIIVSFIIIKFKNKKVKGVNDINSTKKRRKKRKNKTENNE